MRWLAIVCVAGLLAGCGPSASEKRTQKQLNDFFVEWLKNHGETDIIADDSGVGLASSRTRLKASLYDSKQHERGYTVETEFHVVLPDGREIVEFVAGLGETQDAAINDSLANFTLTTFHVVYKCFLNDADPHQEIKPMHVGGVQRQVAFGDLYLRGSPGENIDLGKLRPAIEDAIAELELDEQPHWIKIVYGQAEGKPITIAATLDNDDEPALTDTITTLDWPQTASFYMAKQFIVIK